MSPDGLNWEPLSSSHVAAMAWNPDTAELFVQFKDGSVYKYSSDEEEANGLRNAESPGRFVRYFLRGKGERLQ